MKQGDIERAGQIAIGEKIAIATDHSTAIVQVLHNPTVQLTAEASRRLLDQQLKIELAPELHEIFRIVREPSDIFQELYRGYDGTGVEPFDLPYVAEREGISDVQEALASELNLARAILLRARTGLGKTREIGELLRAFTVAGWTAYIYDARRGRLQVPKSLHLGQTQKVVLVFDNLHDAAADAKELRDWLKEMIEGIRRQLAPADLRVIVTCKSEPQYVARLGCNSQDEFWSGFKDYALADFTKGGLERLLTWLAATQKVEVTPALVSKMVSESDGTPVMFAERVRTARLTERTLTLESWRAMRLRDWGERFPGMCRESPDAFPVLSAVLLLERAGLPLKGHDVLELAARLKGAPVEDILAQLINNRLIGGSPEALQVFGAEQLSEGLEREARPLRTLQDSWPLIVETIGARRDQRAAGLDLLTLAKASAAEGNLKSAVEIATAALAHAECQSAGHFLRGLFQLLGGEMAAGKRDLGSALALGYSPRDGHLLLGLAELVSGNAKAAEVCLTRGLAQAAESGQSPFWLGRALARCAEGRFEEAEADLTKAMDASGNDSTPFLVRGSLRLLRNHEMAALEDLERALALGRRDGLVFLLRGAALRNRDAGRAEADLSAAIDHGGVDAVVYVLRGAVRAARGNARGAEDDFATAIQEGVARRDLLFARGVARLQLGLYADSDNDFTEAIGDDSSATRNYMMRAAARAGRKDWAGAEEDLTIAMKLGGDEAELLRRRGEMRWEMGKRMEADRDLRRAAQLEPQKGWLHRMAKRVLGRE